MKKYWVYIIATIISCNVVYAQRDTVAVITVLSGSSLNYNFNSYTKIRDGISVPYSTGWTNLRLFFRVRDLSTNPPSINSAEWQLSVRSATTNIQGDAGGGTSLPLSTIRLRVSSFGGNVTPSSISADWISPTTVDQRIARGLSTNASMLTGNLTISYVCGTTTPACTSVMSADPGYYFGDLIFTLTRYRM